MEDLGINLPPKQSKEEVLRLLERYPLPPDITFSYGTAGFRYDASLLPGIMVRVGLLAAYRSITLQQQVGVMVTASHNDESYNGAKIADPHGGMLKSDGEDLAVAMANCRDAQQVYAMVHTNNTYITSIHANSNATAATPPTPTVHVGRDTRSHSPALAQLVIRSAQAMGATVINHGIVHTPLLHHAVLHSNPHQLPPLIPVRPGVLGYYSLLTHSYVALCKTGPTTTTTSTSRTMMVDCACGVGYAHVQRLAQQLAILGATLQIVPKNSPEDGPLNTQCGSEYVQKGFCPPTWFASTADNPMICDYTCSVDGDADRIVFFTTNPNNNNAFSLFDGDKMAVLVCDFLQDQVAALYEAALAASTTTPLPPLKLGVVQTAYANGASTTYLQQSKSVPVVFAKTGVKFVHHAAHTQFDVGVYFEANGHGTVLFGNAFYNFMAAADQVVRAHVSFQRLKLLPCLINQSVGDALSDLLLIDAILQLKQWDMNTWDSLYQDMPSRQCKVHVKDRTMIQTNESETRVLVPEELQLALDKAVADIDGGRAFIRPSGTENVVRVYAEANTSHDADWLATKAAQLVYDWCEGTQEPPSFVSVGTVSKM